MNKGKNPFGGFTLLELILAMLILVIVIGIIYSSLRIGIGAWERAEDRVQTSQEARIALGKISSSLRSIYLPERGRKIIPLETKNGTFHQEDNDELKVLTAARPQRDDEYPQGGLKEITFYLEREPGEVSGKIKQLEKRSYYVDKEDILRGEIESGVATTLAGDALRLNFRFYDGSEWSDEWDFEKEKKLPRLVEVAISLLEKGESCTYRTAVDIPSASAGKL